MILIGYNFSSINTLNCILKINNAQRSETKRGRYVAPSKWITIHRLKISQSMSAPWRHTNGFRIDRYRAVQTHRFADHSNSNSTEMVPSLRVQLNCINKTVKLVYRKSPFRGGCYKLHAWANRRRKKKQNPTTAPRREALSFVGMRTREGLHQSHFGKIFISHHFGEGVTVFWGCMLGLRFCLVCCSFCSCYFGRKKCVRTKRCADEALTIFFVLRHSAPPVERFY